MNDNRKAWTINVLQLSIQEDEAISSIV